jgi:hypothetical protein
MNAATFVPLKNEEYYSTYLEEIKKYYSLKSKYETYRDKMKKKIQNTDSGIDVKKKLFAKLKYNCVNCGFEGGTVFTEHDNKLKAICGNIAKPCDLNIEIDKYNVLNVYAELEKSMADLLTIKNEFVSTKLDYLFNYIEEENVVELFEALKKKFAAAQEIFNGLLTLYNSITYNEEERDMIKNRLGDHHVLVNEFKSVLELYKKTSENKYLKECMEIYLERIKTLDKSMLEMKYSTNAIEYNDDLKISRLIQRRYSIENMEIIKHE